MSATLPGRSDLPRDSSEKWLAAWTRSTATGRWNRVTFGSAHPLVPPDVRSVSCLGRSSAHDLSDDVHHHALLQGTDFGQARAGVRADGQISRHLLRIISMPRVGGHQVWAHCQALQEPVYWRMFRQSDGERWQYIEPRQTAELAPGSSVAVVHDARTAVLPAVLVTVSFQRGEVPVVDPDATQAPPWAPASAVLRSVLFPRGGVWSPYAPKRSTAFAAAAADELRLLPTGVEWYQLAKRLTGGPSASKKQAQVNLADALRHENLVLTFAGRDVLRAFTSLGLSAPAVLAGFPEPIASYATNRMPRTGGGMEPTRRIAAALVESGVIDEALVAPLVEVASRSGAR